VNESGGWCTNFEISALGNGAGWAQRRVGAFFRHLLSIVGAKHKYSEFNENEKLQRAKLFEKSRRKC
jgi:hypothetical protein